MRGLWSLWCLVHGALVLASPRLSRVYSRFVRFGVSKRLQEERHFPGSAGSAGSGLHGQAEAGTGTASLKV